MGNSRLLSNTLHLSSAKMGLRLTPAWPLFGVFLALYLLPLGVRPLVIPDEVRYGEVPREMLASGDWIVPHLNGLRYFEKPPLGYWLNAASMALFGENAFAIRLPSAIAAGLTALLLFAWARRFTDDEAVPWLTTVVFLLSFEVLAIGAFCVLDSVLSLFLTAVIVTLHLAYEEQSPRKRMLLLVLAGIACGLAFLTKGFLALVVPAVVIVPFAYWQGRLKICLRTAWVPLLTAVVVVFPWGIAIHRREPDFWHYFFWVEHVDRFVSPNGGQHPAPFWFYAPVLIAGAMPWTFLIGPIVQGMRHANWKHPMIRLAGCWFALPLLLFSASSGKLGTYILPCFPPLAFLIAVGLLTCLRSGDTKGFVTGAWVLMLGAGALLLVLVTALLRMPEMYDRVAAWEWGARCGGTHTLGRALPSCDSPAAHLPETLALLCRPGLVHVQLGLHLSRGAVAEEGPRRVPSLQNLATPEGYGLHCRERFGRRRLLVCRTGRGLHHGWRRRIRAWIGV